MGFNSGFKGLKLTVFNNKYQYVIALLHLHFYLF